MDLSGTTALVTGATGGIGQAIARALVARGATVRLSGRRVDVLEPLAKELGATVVAADLADRADVERLADGSLDVDVLIANAALPASGDLRSFSVEQIDRALDVNLRAPIVLSREIGAAMAERGSGHIVLISSLAGKATTPGSSLYSATKFGLRGFGQALRGDLHGTGVGVSVVFPGFIRDAGMFHDSGAELPAYVGTRTPEQVAAAVISAVERDRGEVDVAPASVRAGVVFSQLAPATSARITRRMGSDRVSQQVAAGQRDKR
jgi:short-subunit dehydrogenase